MTPAALVDCFSGEISTGSLGYDAVIDALAGMTIAEVRQVERLAPALCRLRRLADVELGRRAARRLRTAPVPNAYAVAGRPRTDSREEL